MTDQAAVFKDLFTPDQLERLFPEDRADRFFDALLGDAAEGAYDIGLAYKGFADNQLRFDLELRQRPGKCLACNLTYGLPTVFSRHPVIDLAGIVAGIDRLMDGHGRCVGWRLEATREIDRHLHVVPLVIEVQNRQKT